MEIAVRMLWVSLLVLLILGVGGIMLQIFLSKKENRWLGLILPALSFLWSLLYLANLRTEDSILQTILVALFTIVLTNIPTIVLLAIYAACRERRRRRDDVDKMNIQDL